MNKKHFVIFLDNCTHKSHGKADNKVSTKLKVKGKPDKINELILKTKADLKEEHNNI